MDVTFWTRQGMAIDVLDLTIIGGDAW